MTAFTSVLIANRGEIAVRIIRACREAKLRSIAIYSDADANALHVRQADEAHRIGPPPPAESYLRGDLIVDIARKVGTGAIHPGYGFLSENADFAQLCLDAGLVWIGPSPAAMRLLGDKAAAKALAQQVGVPTLPGYHGDAQDDATLRAEADRIGFPLLVKAVAGGGGRGMREVHTPDDLAEALAAARREALAAFGNDRLLLERYLERPRHVEMQILGDEHGTLLYLGERDCSIQRRHQKVIEEAPAPNFTPDQRRAMGEASVALARAANYINAGTVEFLLDQDGQFYFLEVNTRLQVEHPITEMVTGLDLVQLQLRTAGGEPLVLRQNTLTLSGHAIECRLYAEDPASGFLPSTGQITSLGLPLEDDFDDETVELRVDLGVDVGSRVTPFYDAMLAKIIVHAQSREAAIDQIARALAWTNVEGVRTNVEFLKALIASDDFGAARVQTGFIEEHGLGQGQLVPPGQALAAAAASELRHQATAPRQRPSPWHQIGPWRPAWVGSAVCYLYEGETYRVGIRPPEYPNGAWRFDLPDGSTVERDVTRASDTNYLLDDDDMRGGAVKIPAAWLSGDSLSTRRWVKAGRRRLDLELTSGLASSDNLTDGSSAQHDLLPAPMPGRIVKLTAKPGDHVKMNQTLVVLEAMKIEHLVLAPRDGVVEQVMVKEGDQVDLGAPLIELEEEK